MASRRRGRRRGADWFIGRVMLLLTIFAAFVFGVSVIASKLLPLKLLLLVFAALLLLCLLVLLLTWNPRNRVRYVIGLILSLILCVVFAVGTVFVFKGVNTARTVTTTKLETATVGIYVPIEDANDFAAGEHR